MLFKVLLLFNLILISYEEHSSPFVADGKTSFFPLCSLVLSVCDESCSLGADSSREFDLEAS